MNLCPSGVHRQYLDTLDTTEEREGDGRVINVKTASTYFSHMYVGFITIVDKEVVLKAL